MTTPERYVCAVLPASERIDLHTLPEGHRRQVHWEDGRTSIFSPSTGIEQQNLRNAAPSVPTASRG